MCCRCFRNNDKNKKHTVELNTSDDDSDYEYLMENLVIHKVPKKSVQYASDKMEKNMPKDISECRCDYRPPMLRRYSSTPIICDSSGKSSLSISKTTKETGICCNMDCPALKKDVALNTARGNNFVIEHKHSYEIDMPEDLEETINHLRFSQPPKRLPGVPARNQRHVKEPLKKKKQCNKSVTIDSGLKSFDEVVERVVNSAGGDEAFSPCSCTNETGEVVTGKKGKQNPKSKGKRNLKWKIIIKHHPKETK